MNKILEELNSAQKQAVENFKGPALVIAGAGSGKTRVLTYRIAYMLSQGIEPSSILALTFTNKAAGEMKERIATLVGSKPARRIWMGTFHSIFARILRSEAEHIGFPSNYTIYDAHDSRSLIKMIIKEMKLDDKVYKPNEIHGRISNAKNNLIIPEVYAGDQNILNADRSVKKPETAEIYKRYYLRCKRSGSMDFDDLLLYTNLLFRDHPEILDKYMNKFRYILVDEYQDTNYAQYLIIKKLAGQHKNVCVVGDDAQSIYSFRGARIENILTFQRDFPKAKLIKLERNYRSSRNIVNAANTIISRNKEQITKKVFSENDEGDKIKVLEAKTDNEEGFLIAGLIRENSLRDQIRYKDFGILYRTNAQSRIFEESMRKMNIPYKVYGGVSFFQRKEIKDILAYFRLVENPADDESLRRIINYPKRGIGKTTLEKVQAMAQQQNSSLWDILNNTEIISRLFNKGTASKLFSFVRIIRDFRKKAEEMEAFDLAYTILSATGIMKEIAEDKTPEGISRYENIEELLNGIKEFTENEENEEERSLSTYLQTVSLYTDKDTEDEDGDNKVTLMTVHSAKGLEFKEVFVAGLEEDLFPSHMSSSSLKELEEERRLFYVAVTRAKEKVFLSFTGTRYKWGQLNYCRPSRFITEIDEVYLELPSSFTTTQTREERSMDLNPQVHPGIRQKPGFAKKFSKIDNSSGAEDITPVDPSKIMTGMKVEHPRFGIGKVINKEGIPPNIKATVFFKDHGQKQLLLKFARLKIIE